MVLDPAAGQGRSPPAAAGWRAVDDRRQHRVDQMPSSRSLASARVAATAALDAM
jgi:hypothetical protein